MPKKGCETEKIDPLTKRHDLIISKQQKPQKSVQRVLQGQKNLMDIIILWCLLHYLPMMISQISLKRSNDGE